MTVVFSDLVDSTVVADRLDPEDYGDLIRAFHEICETAIADSGGHLAQYLGDGVLAYFGYPVARERDAQAAVRAALAITRHVGALSQSEPLQVRVGIHTGLVVTGEVGFGAQKSNLAVGSTVNIASRLQGLALPNRVVVSDQTRRLAREGFGFEALGPRQLKGIAVPIEAFEVTGEAAGSGAASALDPVAPLVGRERERAAALELLPLAEAGSGQTLLVSGEAGIGKSRLLDELRLDATRLGFTFLECRCAPHRESSALHPAVELLQRAWRLGPMDPSDEREARLREALASSRAGLDDALPLLASLLSIPLEQPEDTFTASPERRRERTLVVIVDLLADLAREHPVLLVVEDLHWIDPSSLELLDLLLERVPAARFLVALSFRPIFKAPWDEGNAITRLDLERLDPAQTRELMRAAAGGRQLPEEVAAALDAKADGIPLYVEELTRTLLESGQLEERAGAWAVRAPQDALEIPVTLRESLMARLDRLAQSRDVLQHASVLGRRFSYALLRAVTPSDERTLQLEIARLLDADVLRAEGAPPDAVYTFKHALIQDAAYEALLRGQRQSCHRRVAEALEGELAQDAQAQPEVLGRHWAEAGEVKRAIDGYSRAGRWAIERSANVEASQHLNRALQLVQSLEAGPARDRIEVAVRLDLGVALVAARGFTAEEVEQVYARTRELCDRTGDPQQLYDALSGLFLFHQARAELATALDLTHQRLAVAERLGDEGLVTLVHENLGTLAFWRGEFRQGLDSVERALAGYEPERAREIARVYGTESSVVCETYAAQLLFFLGYPEQARARGERAVQRAREVGHANSLGLALAFHASLLHMLRDPKATRAYADEAVAFADEQRLGFWVGMGTIFQGCADIADGRPAEGIATMVRGMAGHEAAGSRLGGALCLAFLADGYRGTGQLEDGLGVLSGGVAMLGAYEDRFFDAEVARTRGELLREAGRPEEAEQQFRAALEIARRQGGRMLALRAATGLARLGSQSGDSAAALETLSGITASFEEGFALPDLVEAWAILEGAGGG